MRLNEMQLFSTPVAQETILAGDVPLTVSTFNSSETTIEDCVNEYTYIKYSDSVGQDNAFNVVDLEDVIRKCHLWQEKLPQVEPFYGKKIRLEVEATPETTGRVTFSILG